MKAISLSVALAVACVLVFGGSCSAAQGTPQPKATVLEETAPDQWGTPLWVREDGSESGRKENRGEKRSRERPEEPIETDCDAFKLVAV
jgi:hypothetical protein